jgi:TolA-binding protein
MVRTKKNITLFGCVLICMTVSCLLAACHRKAPEKQPEVIIDMAAIQDAYNQGLQFYADEQYVEAKKSWQRVIQMGPNTQLAARARAYIKKVNQMLKTLKEIEKKR